MNLKSNTEGCKCPIFEGYKLVQNSSPFVHTSLVAHYSLLWKLYVLISFISIQEQLVE